MYTIKLRCDVSYVRERRGAERVGAAEGRDRRRRPEVVGADWRQQAVHPTGWRLHDVGERRTHRAVRSDLSTQSPPRKRPRRHGWTNAADQTLKATRDNETENSDSWRRNSARESRWMLLQDLKT